MLTESVIHVAPSWFKKFTQLPAPRPSLATLAGTQYYFFEFPGARIPNPQKSTLTFVFLPSQIYNYILSAHSNRARTNEPYQLELEEAQICPCRSWKNSNY